MAEGRAFARNDPRLRTRAPAPRSRILTPDFRQMRPGRRLETVRRRETADVFQPHNLENRCPACIPRSACGRRYRGALISTACAWLQRVKGTATRRMFTKSGIMSGAGEDRQGDVAGHGRHARRDGRFPDAAEYCSDTETHAVGAVRAFPTNSRPMKKAPAWRQGSLMVSGAPLTRSLSCRQSELSPVCGRTVLDKLGQP